LSVIRELIEQETGIHSVVKPYDNRMVGLEVSEDNYLLLKLKYE